MSQQVKIEVADRSKLISFRNQVACLEIMSLLTLEQYKLGRDIFLFNSLRFNVSTIFLFEDGHGNVDENGGPKPMDYIVDQNEFIVETIATHTEYLKDATSGEYSLTYPMSVEKSKDEDIRMKETKPKRDYVCYTVQDKSRFFDLKIEKCMSASAAAKQLGIHIRTTQRWFKQYSLCLKSIFNNCKKVGRKCILSEEHKMTVIGLIDANPSVTVIEVTEYLLKRLHDLKVSLSTVYNLMRSECNLSLKKADFHSIERNSPAKVEERYDWVCKWENTDMRFLTNCVFLDESAFDINMKRSRALSKKARVPLLPGLLREQAQRLYGCYPCCRFDYSRCKKTETCEEEKG